MWCQGCLFYSVSLFDTSKKLQETVISGRGKDKVLLMDVSGIISTEERQQILALRSEASMVARVREELNKAEADERIKGLILKINSPGGTVTASDILYREILTFKKRKGIPVIACLMDLAASGGYYVALVADRIIAHPTSVTGSIGVVALKLNIKALMDKVGVEDETVKAGDKKDMWSPFRPSTPEEREIIQSILDDLYERFLEVVQEGRKGLTSEEIRGLADGKIFTAKQALRAGLVDEVGYLEDAIALAKKEAALDTAKVVAYHRRFEYKNNIYSRAGTLDVGALSLLNADLGIIAEQFGLRFMYLWTP
jgi:protease-4